MKRAKYFNFRLLAVLLAGIMLLAVFAGCGKKTDDAPATIRLGFVLPVTGPYAPFTESFQWVLDMALPVMNADGGFYIKEYDKRIPVEIIIADSESDPTKASEAAQKLVTTDNVHILVGAWTPETTIPVSIVAETNSLPALMYDSPMEVWLEGGPYEWSHSIMFSLVNLMESYIDAWDKVDSNKKVGFIFGNDIDGVAFAGLAQEFCDRRGYNVVDPGRFPPGTSDYSSLINMFKQEDCDIVLANSITPDYVTFFQQFYQLDFMPKVLTVGKGIHFESNAMAIGSAELANGLTTGLPWDRAYPWSSSLLGMSTTELCDKWEADHPGLPYHSSIAYDLSCLEVLTVLLNTAQTLDREALKNAFPTLTGDTIYGPINFVDNNVFECAYVISQYVLGEKFPLEKNLVAHGKFTQIPESTKPIVIMNERNIG